MEINDSNHNIATTCTTSTSSTTSTTSHDNLSGKVDGGGGRCEGDQQLTSYDSTPGDVAGGDCLTGDEVPGTDGGNNDMMTMVNHAITERSCEAGRDQSPTTVPGCIAELISTAEEVVDTDVGSEALSESVSFLNHSIDDVLLENDTYSADLPPERQQRNAVPLESMHADLTRRSPPDDGSSHPPDCNLPVSLVTADDHEVTHQTPTVSDPPTDEQECCPCANVRSDLTDSASSDGDSSVVYDENPDKYESKEVLPSAGDLTALTRTILSRQQDETGELRRNRDEDLLSELDAELGDLLTLETFARGDPPNGMLKSDLLIEEMPEFKLLRTRCNQLQMQVAQQEVELSCLQESLTDRSKQTRRFEQQRESLEVELKQAMSVQEVHLLRIKEVEEQQKAELTAAKERQLSHDAAAKKAVTKLQQEMILRVDQVKCMYEDAVREKEAMVIKYAKSEKEVLDQKKARELLERRYREMNLTVESLSSQLKDAKKDKTKMKSIAATKETEAATLQKELDQLKEEVSSQAIKVKWAQNKLKTELDSHKETKVKLAKTEHRLTEAKEETEQIRKNCQDIISTYQTSEEVKSNSLDKQLKVKHSELEQKLQEEKDYLEIHQARLRELESLKKSLADHVAELDSYKVKARCLEDERLKSEELLAKFKELLNSQKEENRRLNKQLDEKKTLAHELEELKRTENQLRSEVSGQKVDQSDLETELEVSREKESELLQFTQKITTRNTDLSSENSTLQSKTSQLQAQVVKLQSDVDSLQTGNDQLNAELSQERLYRERESSILATKLNEKSCAVEQLSIQLDEARDDNKTLKRKHVANTKDLTRQLQNAHKRLESLESTDNPSRDTISVGSRTSSSGSLDMLPSCNPGAVTSAGSSGSVLTSGSSRHEEHAGSDHTVAIASGNDYPGVDKGMLVDRIVRLQKAHLRKNDKMEFLQEHVAHLIEELKKKSKIIQQYIMRDDFGALTPASSDVNKAQMSKQGGIMSSLYRSQQTDPTMTLELSLEINRKLQAVLEDTLLKNITLKENIETLGQEIARLLKDQQTKKGHQPTR